MTHAPGRIFGLIAGLFLLGALFGGCTSARSDKPLPLEKATFSGSASQLQIDLPGRRNAVTQPLPVAPEAAPFVRDATRFDTERQDGLQLVCAAVHFDNAAIAGRLGAPGTPARQNFYAAFQESALSAFIAESSRSTTPAPSRPRDGLKPFSFLTIPKRGLLPCFTMPTIKCWQSKLTASFSRSG